MTAHFEKGKLHGLDLFSGIGGIGIALELWVRTVAYCERDRYAQGVLLSRMRSGEIDRAPIWDDVTTLRGDMLPRIDIVFGGFPCQDLSVAGRGKAWQESEAVFSLKSSDSSENAIPDLFSSKTSLPFEPVEGKEWLKNWPRSGMTVDGRLFQPPQLAPPTKGKDGSYLPTPTASEGGYNKSPGANSKLRPTLTTMARHNLWPTPCARDWKDNGKSPAELERNSTTLATIAGGQLNPQWVEWLMGYKTGWTELSASAIAWFRCKHGKRSKNF